MPAQALAGRGELGMGVEEHGPRQVARSVQVTAGRPGERPAHVGDAQCRVVEVGEEPVDADDRPRQAQHGADDSRAQLPGDPLGSALALGSAEPGALEGASDGTGVGVGAGWPGSCSMMARLTVSSTPMSRKMRSPLDQV